MKRNAAILAWLTLVLTVILVSRFFDAPSQAIESSSPVANTAMNNGISQKKVTPGQPEPLSTAMPEHLPASLRGTQVDGVLRADKDGNLVISDDIRRVFDYFLATLGEEPLSLIHERLLAYIRLQLPANAASQAEQLLKNYLALNEALAAIQAPEGVAADNDDDTAILKERLMAMQELRRQYLPVEVIDAFYSDDDALDQLALRRMDIMNDANLSASQRDSALQDAEQSLPPHLQQVTNDLNKHQQMDLLTAILRGKGGSDGDIYQLRQSFYGSEAADRLAQLDHSRQQWRERTHQWLEERDRIMARQDLDERTRKLEIERSREQHFEPIELKRIEVLEQLHDKSW